VYLLIKTAESRRSAKQLVLLMVGDHPHQGIEVAGSFPCSSAVPCVNVDSVKLESQIVGLRSNASTHKAERQIKWLSIKAGELPKSWVERVAVFDLEVVIIISSRNSRGSRRKAGCDGMVDNVKS
jgi:hypothetical protein